MENLKKLAKEFGIGLDQYEIKRNETIVIDLDIQDQNGNKLLNTINIFPPAYMNKSGNGVHLHKSF